MMCLDKYRLMYIMQWIYNIIRRIKDAFRRRREGC